MVVKVIKAGKAGSGRALATYVLDLKHEHAGERLGAYALDLRHGGEKVEWARTVNTGVDDPRWAVQAIEQHNARNPRKHSISRYEHIVVSFAEGERPHRRQMAVIEDRLCAAIGFGDHPRVSAVHRNTENLHLHIAVSRIDPTTLKAKHPRHNHFALQAEAARLEISLGLRQERKTLLGRERQEIDRRLEIDRAVDGWHPEPPTPAAPGRRPVRKQERSDKEIPMSEQRRYPNDIAAYTNAHGVTASDTWPVAGRAMWETAADRMADRLPDGQAKTVQDVAAEISPAYREARAEKQGLEREASQLSEQRRRLEWQRDRVEAASAAYRDQHPIRSFLHDHSFGLFQDQELAACDQLTEQATQAIDRLDHAAEANAPRLEAAQARHDGEFEKVRGAAERGLRDLQGRAQAGYATYVKEVMQELAHVRQLVERHIDRGEREAMER